MFLRCVSLIGVGFVLMSMPACKSSLADLKLNDGPKLVGSGVSSSERRQLADFSRIDFAGIGRLEVKKGKFPEVVVVVDDNLQKHFESKVSSETLHLGFKQGSISTKTVPVVTVTVPVVTELQLSGATSAKILDIDQPKLRVDESGAATVELTGRIARLDLELSGAAKVNAPRLRVIDARVNLSGAATAHVDVSTDLKATLSGASKLDVTGTPTHVTKSVSGVSEVRHNMGHGK